MKNIAEINVLDYFSYYFVGDVDTVVLKVKRSDGYHEIDGYDIIDTGSGKIVAFTKEFSGQHDFVYETNNGLAHLQLVSFDNLVDIINLKPYNDFKFYLFVNSVEVPAYEEYIENSDVKSKNLDGKIAFRCDYNNFGGMPFNIPDQGYVIKKMFNVLSFSGIGHIGYFETANSENQNPYHKSINAGARTYAGILKAIYEWAVVADEPFNSQEEIAQKAKLMWEKLNLPDDLKNWIINDYCDMRVSRYLKGDNVISQDVEGEEVIPSSLSNYMLSNCRYSTLNDLRSNHPNGQCVPLSASEDELSAFKEYLDHICLINGIEYSSLQDLRRKLLLNEYNFFAPSEISLMTIVNTLINNE